MCHGRSEGRSHDGLYADTLDVYFLFVINNDFLKHIHLRLHVRFLHLLSRLRYTRCREATGSHLRERPKRAGATNIYTSIKGIPTLILVGTQSSYYYLFPSFKLLDDYFSDTGIQAL